MVVTVDDATRSVGLLFSILSAFGALFTIITYVILNKKSFHSNLVLNLAIADLLNCIFLVFNYSITDSSLVHFFGFCVLMTTLEDIITSSTFLWTSFIGIQLFWTPSNKIKWKKIFFLLGWGVPTLISIFSLFLDWLLTPRQNLLPYACHFIDDKSFTSIFFFATFGVNWIFITWSYIGSLMYRLYQKLKKFYYDRQLQDAKEIDSLLDTNQPLGRDDLLIEANTSSSKLAIYLLNFTLCWIGPVAGTLIVWAHPSLLHDSAFLHQRKLVDFTAILQGFFNAFAYGFSSEVKVYFYTVLVSKKKLNKFDCIFNSIISNSSSINVQRKSTTSNGISNSICKCPYVGSR